MSQNNLDLTLKQNLVLTPQLKQAIKILNMNEQELQTEIVAMLDKNFMLKREDDVYDEVSEKKEESEEIEIEITIDNLGDELSFDAEWQDNFEDWQQDSGEKEQFSQIADNNLQELSAFLLQQIQQMPIDEKLQQNAVILLYSLDENGYLRESFSNLQKEYKLSINELESALKVLQSCQPVGVGARDLKECLSLQLQALPPETNYLSILYKIFVRYFDYIAESPDLIKSRLNISEEEYQGALNLLKTLNPYPCSEFNNTSKNDYSAVEVIVREKNGISYVELNEAIRPKITLNHLYANLNSSNSNERTLLSAQLQEAKWFLSALDKRYDTIKRVAQVVVAMQQDFFQFGETAMRPLTRQKVAEILQIHESTVSRAVNGKYLSCKRGIFELRHFFSSTHNNDEQSSIALKAILQDLINKETYPKSDQELSLDLEKIGYKVARRTVAKYRESMNIPSANKRKK